MSSTPATASTTAALVAHHRRVVRRRWLIIAALFTLAVLAFVVSTMVGAITIPFGQVLRGLVNPASLDDQTATVLYSLRLPMAAAAITTGASLWRGVSAETMLLLGIGLVFLFQALLALIQYRASTEALSQIVFWSMGSLTRATWIGNAILAAILVLALPIFAAISWQMTPLVGVPFFLFIILTKRRTQW